MKVLPSISQIREEVAGYRAGGAVKIGFVPTMGYLHEGHMALVKQARSQCSHVIVSIYVNPTQFAANEDLSSYPTDTEADLKKCDEAGVDVVFLPNKAEIYPDGFNTYVESETGKHVNEGGCRPHFFRGVATVVVKLFNIVTPDYAYFGQKDFQQCAVIKRVVADLNMSVTVVVSPTVREGDGLAMSSRNAYLSAEERRVAPTIYNAMKAAKDIITGGTVNGNDIRAKMTSVISNAPGQPFSIHYTSVARVDDLAEIEGEIPDGDKEVLLSVAATLGKARLIDNMVVNLS